MAAAIRGRCPGERRRLHVRRPRAWEGAHHGTRAPLSGLLSGRWVDDGGEAFVSKCVECDIGHKNTLGRIRGEKGRAGQESEGNGEALVHTDQEAEDKVQGC